MMWVKLTDERTKKAFLILCALFIIILLIFGLIYSLIHAYLNKKMKQMDTYMFDLCKYQIVKTPSEFVTAVKYYEKRRIYESSRWLFRGVMLLFLVTILYGVLFNKGDVNGVFRSAKYIFPSVHWQTIGDVNKTLVEQGLDKIPGWNWMPVSFLPIVKTSPLLDTSNPTLYVSLFFYFILIILIFKISGCALTYQVRIKRAEEKSKEVFQKSLDNVNFAMDLQQPIQNKDTNENIS